MERWSAIKQEDVHLATIRVYSETSKIKLFLPHNDENPDEPEEYELDMVQASVENQIVVAEQEKEPGSRARNTILAGKVQHECNLRPVFTEKYRRRMRERVRLANTPQRQIVYLDGAVGARGAINQLSSGVSNTGNFDLVVRPILLFPSLSSSHLYSEIETKAPERPVRAYGSYGQERATRPAVHSFQRKGDLVNQSLARENSTAGSIPQRDPARDRVLAPQWRIQRSLGTARELPRRGTLVTTIIIYAVSDAI